MGINDTNGAVIRGQAMSDFLKTLNTRLLQSSIYTLCVPRLLKPDIECPGMQKCNQCVEEFVSKKYEGGF